MPFLGFMSGMGMVVILGYGGTLVLRSQIRWATGRVRPLPGMFFGPIQTMGDLYNAILSTAASAERIFQLLDTEPQVQDRPGAQSLAPIRGMLFLRT